MLRFVLLLLVVSLTDLTPGIGFGQNAPTPRRPLVFIPGILGSEIFINDERVWGDLWALRQLAKLEIEDGPRDVLPAATCSSADHNDPLRNQICGTIQTFVTLPPFGLNQYGRLFNYLERELKYRRSGEGRNLFIFPYDWRLSNYETAKALNQFVTSEPGLAWARI